MSTSGGTDGNGGYRIEGASLDTGCWFRGADADAIDEDIFLSMIENRRGWSICVDIVRSQSYTLARTFPAVSLWLIVIAGGNDLS